MITSTVLQLDTERLIREGEAAVDLYNNDLKNARLRIMPMALGLLAARIKYPANQDFGDWLQTSSYREIGQSDRAALIKIGEVAEFAGKFMRSTFLISPQTILDAIRDLLPSSYDRKTTSISVDNSKQSKMAPSNAEIEKPTESIGEIEPWSAPLTSKSGFFEAPRSSEIAEIFRHSDARRTLSRIWKMKTGRKQIWELILIALDGGLLTPNDRAISEPTLSLLFPKAPTSALRAHPRLDNHKGRPSIRNVLLPKMIACRERLLATPERFQQILAEYDDEQCAKTKAGEENQKREAALTMLPAGQQECVMFGRTVWPRIDERQGVYSYDQVRAAIWTFREFETWNRLMQSDTNIGSHAIRIRCSLRYLGEFLSLHERGSQMRQIFGLMQWFSHLMEKAPDAVCKWPAYPHVEGQW